MSEMRKGWTTGACAAAAARAAASRLVSGKWPDPVEIRLPKHVTARFSLASRDEGEGFAQAGIIKDAGDDPDVTHGALVLARVERGEKGSGLVIKAGEGVGTVTLPGLPITVGEAAVTPGPRAQIADNLREFGEDFTVTLSIAGGAKLAEKTMNARLGVLGGLSILGTTGIVTPYSNAAWIGAIQRAVDVARAANLAHLAAATGNASEQAAKRMYGLPETALIDIGGFIGPLLKYLKVHPVPRLTIAGGIAKMSKLAQGHLDLHSKNSAVDPSFLAQISGDERLLTAGSASAALELAGESLSAKVAQLALNAARQALGREATQIDLLVVDRSGKVVGHAV